MEPCKSLKAINSDEILIDNDYIANRLGIERADSRQFICPKRDAEMSIVGNFEEKDFDYIQLRVHQC